MDLCEVQASQKCIVKPCFQKKKGRQRYSLLFRLGYLADTFSNMKVITHAHMLVVSEETSF